MSGSASRHARGIVHLKYAKQTNKLYGKCKFSSMKTTFFHHHAFLRENLHYSCCIVR